MWSSLPVLVLWMIKDKLDIFDNYRLAAVCRDWRSASACYPRMLSSVGDGVPWIWQAKFDGTRREFISFLGQTTFVLDRPEFDRSRPISSKQGWVLLNGVFAGGSGNPLLVFFFNVFTGARIPLPDLPTEKQCDGSFTTRDGVPHRVFLLVRGKTTTVLTALAGDEAWTSRIYSGLKRKPVEIPSLIGVGLSLYFQDTISRVVVFNVANQSFVELAPPRTSGFVAEHDGRLIYIERQVIEQHDYPHRDVGCINHDYSSFAVYQHNEAVPTSWERLDVSAVMDTSWFLIKGRGCVSAKGNGLKVYDLRQMERWNDHLSRTCVIVYDLVAGTSEVHRLPVGTYYPLRWAGIG